MAPGLDLVKDYGYFTISPSRCSGCSTICTAAEELGLVDRRAWWCC
jgi:hypothetical protein